MHGLLPFFLLARGFWFLASSVYPELNSQMTLNPKAPSATFRGSARQGPTAWASDLEGFGSNQAASVVTTSFT